MILICERFISFLSHCYNLALRVCFLNANRQSLQTPRGKLLKYKKSTNEETFFPRFPER